MEPWSKKAVEYAKSASLRKNKNRFGKWVKLACKRFLNDLERASSKNAPFYFDEDAVEHVCNFISMLPHVEGKWATETLELCLFQVFFLANIFGFRNHDGSRRFSSALFVMARKNAKSTIAAAIGLYCLTMDDELGPQVISAATTGDQAFIVFNVGKRMVDRTKQLRTAFRLEAYTRAISCLENGGLMKPINSKASTQDGLNPSCSILDEIHAHRSHDLLNVLHSASGARRSPLFIFTTTEGYETPGPWPEMRKFSQQILEGAVEADHFFTLMYTIDKDDDEFNEDIWEKANPLLATNEILLDRIRKDAKDAKAMPGRHVEFLIKRVNRQSSVSEGWIDLKKWKQCDGPVDLEWLKEYPCYGALDLASTRDLTSLRLVWLVDGLIYTHGWRFVPETTVQLRIDRNLVPYGAWVKAGHIIKTPGEVTDYDMVRDKVLWVNDNFKLISVAYDLWNAAQIAAKLEKEEIDMIQFIQGPKSYHPAMKYFEESYIAGNLRHGGDPVLTWCASNIVSRLDPNMNMAPDKKKSNDKIDDMTALLMATGIATRNEEEEDNFDDFINDPLTVK